MKAHLTSFATFADLVGYIDCLTAGGSAQACLAKGDNGRGASGHITAQIHTPMIALPRAEMVKRWGSVSAAWGKPVKVTLNGKTSMAQCQDIAPAGICDLNPAALVALGLPADTELKADGEWEWA